MKHRDRTRAPRAFREIAMTAGIIVAIILLFALLCVAAIVAAVIWLVRNR
jgi:type IV secretory pathway TrbD component